MSDVPPKAAYLESEHPKVAQEKVRGTRGGKAAQRKRRAYQRFVFAIAEVGLYEDPSGAPFIRPDGTSRPILRSATIPPWPQGEEVVLEIQSDEEKVSVAKTAVAKLRPSSQPEPSSSSRSLPAESSVGGGVYSQESLQSLELPKATGIQVPQASGTPGYHRLRAAPIPKRLTTTTTELRPSVPEPKAPPKSKQRPQVKQPPPVHAKAPLQADHPPPKASPVPEPAGPPPKAARRVEKAGSSQRIEAPLNFKGIRAAVCDHEGKSINIKPSQLERSCQAWANLSIACSY